MRLFFSLLFLFHCCGPALADTPVGNDPKTEEALRDNVIDFRDWLMKQLSQLQKMDSRRSDLISRNYTFVSKRKKPCFTANQYNQASKSDWVKCQVMQGLSTLGQQLANTAGTAFATQGAGQLQQYAIQLKQSDDPQFQQVGALYSQEAQALQGGDIQGADQTASEVSAIPGPIVSPGYQASPEENSLLQAFNQVIGTVIASLGGILGTLAVAQLLQALGITNLGSLLGTGTSTGTAIASGANPGTALSGAGANVVQAGGGAVMQQLGTVNVKPLAPENSANAGGAPSAQ